MKGFQVVAPDWPAAARPAVSADSLNAVIWNARKKTYHSKSQQTIGDERSRITPHYQPERYEGFMARDRTLHREPLTVAFDPSISNGWVCPDDHHFRKMEKSTDNQGYVSQVHELTEL